MSTTTPTVRDEWGLACPGCGSDEHLQVELSIMAKLTPDYTDTVSDDHIWDQTSYMRCENCGHDGHVSDFTIDEVPHG